MIETEAAPARDTAAAERATGELGATPELGATRRNGKSAAAFRTTAEVAAALDLPAYVLRFWEAKFPQVKPLKRGGGRRYYRPQDVDLLRRIRHCLYHEGYTIRGVQKLLRDGALGGDDPSPADAGAPPARFARDTVADMPEPASRPSPSHRRLREALEEVRRDLLEIRATLERIAPT